MQLILLMMSTKLLETCRELKKTHRKQLCDKLVVYQESQKCVFTSSSERNPGPEHVYDGETSLSVHSGRRPTSEGLLNQKQGRDESHRA